MEHATEAPAKPASAASKTPKEAKKKKKGSCLKVVLIVFVVLLVLVGGFTALALDLPRKWGIVPSRAEKAFDMERADRVAADDLRVALEENDIATEGMEIYVLPRKDGAGSAAYVVLDESQGFAFSRTGGGDPFLGTLAAMARFEAVEDGGIESMAFEYKDAKGRTLVTIGSSVQDASDFADGKLTREQFMQRVGGRADLKNVAEATKEMFE